MTSLRTAIIGSILLATTSFVSGCAAHKPVKARLVIPIECVQSVKPLAALEVDDTGQFVGKSKFEVKYNCVKAQK